MNAAATKPAAFPIGAVVANAVGVLLLAAGLVGLLVPDLANAVPALGDPTTAWTLLGAGIALDVGAAVAIVAHFRSRSRPR